MTFAARIGGPKAHFIPVWGKAPEQEPKEMTGLKARSIPARGIVPRPSHRSVPHIAFIKFDSIFGKKRQVFLLERPGSVMLLLRVDVMPQRIQVPRSDGKRAVSTLPRESGKCGRLGFEPFGGRGFQFLHEFCRSDGAGKTDGEMHMIGDASDPVTFTIRIAGDGGEIGVERGSDAGIKDGGTVFSAENDVDEQE